MSISSTVSLNNNQATEELRTPTVERAQVRVLMIGPSLDFVGGQAVQASRLFSALAQLPQLAMKFFPISPLAPKGFSWIGQIPFVRTIISFFLYSCRLAFTVRQFDVVHIFTAGLSSYTLWTIPALFFGRLFGKKLIINYRDGQAEQHLAEWRSAKPTLLLADQIVTPSDFLVDVFRKYGITAHSIVNMIDTSRFIYRKRSKLRPVFMTNRMLEPLYNVQCVVKAFAIIQAKFADASLTIAHDGCCRQELEKLVQDLRLRNVDFIGKVSQANIPSLYDSADIYLMSPNIDNMPGTLLECFASGLPAVSTAAGGIPYIAKHRESALLVDTKDHEALAARAIELLQNPSLVEYLTENARQELQKYQLKAVRDQWAKLYQKLSV